MVQKCIAFGYFFYYFFLALCGCFRLVRLSIVNSNNSIKILYWYVGMLVLCGSSLFCHAALL